MDVSAIKEAEDGDGLIVRLWNTDTEACQCAVQFWKTPRNVTLCNLGERELEPLALDEDGAVQVAARGREIVTLRARF